MKAKCTGCMRSARKGETTCARCDPAYVAKSRAARGVTESTASAVSPEANRPVAEGPVAAVDASPKSKRARKAKPATLAAEPLLTLDAYAAQQMAVARDYAECEPEPWRVEAQGECVVCAVAALVGWLTEQSWQAATQCSAEPTSIESAHDHEADSRENERPAYEMVDTADGPALSPEPLFDDGRVTLYCGDSLLLAEALLAKHGRPHHVFTDPPYGERVVAGARTSRGTKDVSSGAEAPRAFVPFATEAPTIRGLLARISATRWTVLTCDHVHASQLEVEPPPGLRHVRHGAWVKPDCAPQMTGDRPANGFESIAILHSMDAMRWNSVGKRGVWTHYVERDVPWHPTPKPLALARELLRDFTDPDDLIFDLYAGSGAFGVAARIEGRRAVLVEINPTFARLAAQRLREGRGRVVDSSMPAEGRDGTLAMFARTT